MDYFGFKPILMSLFFKFEDAAGKPTMTAKIFGGVVVLGIIIILYQSFSGQFGFGWGLGSAWGITYWFREHGVAVLGIGALIGFFIWAIVASKPSAPSAATTA